MLEKELQEYLEIQDNMETGEKKVSSDMTGEIMDLVKSARDNGRGLRGSERQKSVL